MARTCENCGYRMPAFRPRQRTADGKLVCPGCHPDGAGEPGRPVGLHGSLHGEAGIRDVWENVKKDWDTLADEPEEDYWDEPEKDRKKAMRFEAHDSGDGKIIYHCPFCGGGEVVGRSDGTAMCDFCSTAFTVQVQPEKPAMPQTNPLTGEPLDVPGMPGDPSAPDATPPGGQEGDQGTAPPGAGPPPGPSPGEQAGIPATPPPGPPPGPAPVTAARYYLTDRGLPLDEESFIKHLAIKHADDKDGVIEDVRQSNRRS